MKVGYFRVVLVEPEHEGNIGSVARAMWNFGLRHLWIVNPKARIGVEARALAAHAGSVLDSARTVTTLRAAIRDCNLIVGTSSITDRSYSNLRRSAISPSALAGNLSRVSGRVAILFGRESSGLTNDELDVCDFLVTVPTNEEYRALNVAQAAAIIFYELFLSKQDRNPNALVEAACKRRLLAYFDSLTKYADIPVHRRGLSKRAFRSIIARGALTRRESTLLMGVFRRLLRRMSSSSKVKPRPP